MGSGRGVRRFGGSGGARKRPIRRGTRSRHVCSSPPFDARPLVRDPAGNLGLVPLDRPPLGTLRTPPQPTGQQTPHRRPRQRHPRHPLDDQADSLQGPQVGLETMSLSSSRQRGPDRLDLGVVQFGRATGGRTPPQGRNAALLPYSTPPSHTLGTHSHRPRDRRIRGALLEQLDRPNAPCLCQLRPRQGRKRRAGSRRRGLISHPESLPLARSAHPPNLRKDQ